jgi:hypothetical protein
VNPILTFFRATLWWLAPLVALLLVIGLETDWGAGLRKPLPADVPLPPKALATELLPNYAIEGGLAANAETVDRTLFNPTRRPAPVALAEAAKPRMQKVYRVTGTTIAGERSLAFLKEVKGGKATTEAGRHRRRHARRRGDAGASGLRWASRRSCACASPRIRRRRSPAPAPAAGGARAPAAQPPAQPGAQPQPARAPTATTQGATAAQSLAERRRAARAAEAARAAGRPLPARGRRGANPPAAAEGTWDSMDQRYRRRAAHRKMSAAPRRGFAARPARRPPQTTLHQGHVHPKSRASRARRRRDRAALLLRHARRRAGGRPPAPPPAPMAADQAPPGRRRLREDKSKLFPGSGSSSGASFLAADCPWATSPRPPPRRWS